MDFENVDVPSLVNALTQCMNSINHKASSELINDISNVSVWQSSSQSNLKNALTILTTNRYTELKDKIDCYLTVASYIAQYQNLSKENILLNKQYNDLSYKLYYEEEYETPVTLADGTVINEINTRKVMDKNINNQMNNIKNKIDKNKEKMDELKKIIYNSI